MPTVVIIGAGIGGLTSAIRLKSQLGLTNFQIFDKASDLGGTWNENIYPGAASDTPIHSYALSSDPNPDWPATLASQSDLQCYWRKLAKKYDLYRHITFNCLVVSAEWNDKEKLYKIITQDSKGIRSCTTAQILITAIGNLVVPRIPNIPGVSTFKGESFHSAEWNASIDLRGKRVAVIGNGSSSCQFVPQITQDPAVQVTQFCRTPNFFLPNLLVKYSPAFKWAFRHVPLFMLAHRWTIYLGLEALYLAVFHNSLFRRFSTTLAKKYILAMAPKADWVNLVPTYQLGCKRLVVDTNWLTSLHRSNLSLNWDGIKTISEHGIITKRGDRLDFDVMIFATGFITDRFPILIRGTNGHTIQEYYDTQAGPTAYLGTAVAGFPNLFMMFGPNTTTGHASVPNMEEFQTDYMMQLVKPIVDGTVVSLDVKPEASDRYNEWLHSRLSRSVHVSCTSWYRTSGDGKVSSIFPASATYFWWLTRRPNWSDFNISGGSRFVQGQRIRRLASPVLFYLTLASALILVAINGGLGTALLQ